MAPTDVPMPPHVEAGPTETTFTSGGSGSGRTTPTSSSPMARRRGWAGVACFAAVWETEPRRGIAGDQQREGTATLEIETYGLVRTKDLVGMRMPIWYDAMQAPRHQRRVARERGTRDGAWLTTVRELVA